MVVDDLEDKPYLLFFMAVFIAPLLEGLYFRYHQNRNYLSIILTFIVTAFAIVTIHYLLIAYAIYLIVLLGLKVKKKKP